MYLIFVIFIMTIAFLILYAAAGRFYGESIAYAEDVEKQLLGQYLLTSPHCFTFYDDSLQRYYPGHVDVSKFKDEQLAKCVRFFPTPFYAHLAYLDKELSYGSRSGGSSFYPVVVIEGGKRYPGILEVAA